MIGIGITTYNRPDYLKQCLTSLLKNIQSVDKIWIYDDGSTPENKIKNIQVWNELVKDEKVELLNTEPNKGVAHAKNTLLRTMIEAGCDDMFILEDDILLLDDRAVTEYIQIAEDYGYGHLMFAHHGDGNVGKEHYEDEFVAYWPNCVGAWCYYTRECIQELEAIEKSNGMAYPGYFDENFHNVWEHVEHTTRLGNAGFTAWIGLFPDIINSKKYIKEIEGSIGGSAIRNDKAWRDNLKKGMAYWKEKHGSDFPEEMMAINLGAERKGVAPE